MKKLFRSKWFYFTLFAAVAAAAWPLTEHYYPVLQKTIAEVTSSGETETPATPETGPTTTPVPTDKAMPKESVPKEPVPKETPPAETKTPATTSPKAAPVTSPATSPKATPAEAPVAAPIVAPTAIQQEAATAPPASPELSTESGQEGATESGAAANSVEEKTFSTLVDAYVYAWPLMLMNKLKEEMTGSIYFAPINKMAYLPVLPSPYWQTGECPNVDSIHSLAWIDLSTGPQVVVIPAEAKHTFFLELLDAWTHVILAFNNREEAAFPERVLDERTVRSFVLVGPDYEKTQQDKKSVTSAAVVSPAIPEGMKVVKSPTNLVWLINRVLLGTPRDEHDKGIASAARCLYEFELMPLETFLKSSHDIPQNTAIGDLFFRAGENGLYLSDGSEDLGKIPAADKKTVDEPKQNSPDDKEKDFVKKVDKQDAQDKQDSQGKQAEEPVEEFSLTVSDESTAEEVGQADSAVNEESESIENEVPLELELPADDEIETDEQVELSTPITRYYLQRYRNRAWYVAYTMQAEPAIKEAVKAPVNEETKQAVPSPVGTLSQNTAGTVTLSPDTINNGVTEEASTTVTVTEEAAPDLREELSDDLHAGEDKMKEWGDAAGKIFHKATQRADAWAKQGWSDTAAMGRYFDRKAKRDLISMDQLVSRFMSRESWSQLAVRNVMNMRGEQYFEEFANLLTANPPAKEDAAMLEELSTMGIVPGKPFEMKSVDPTLLYFMRYAAPFAQSRIRQTAVGGACKQKTTNNWLLFDNFGNYGTNYLERAIVASEFIGANTAKEILYPFTNLDDSGRFLSGENSYVLHFDNEQLPPTDLLWSLTMYDRNHFLVPNRLDRYGIRSNQPLVYNADGSLDLTISREEPKEKLSNWLPAPEGEFMLMMRIYQPGESALSGEWKVPAVHRL